MSFNKCAYILQEFINTLTQNDENENYTFTMGITMHEFLKTRFVTKKSKIYQYFAAEQNFLWWLSIQNCLCNLKFKSFIMKKK